MQGHWARRDPTDARLTNLFRGLMNSGVLYAVDAPSCSDRPHVLAQLDFSVECLSIPFKCHRDDHQHDYADVC